MEKSNSFKRVLAGTLALLTVASSVPADAGSVIGDFFGSSLVAKAVDADELLDAGPKYAVTNFSGSTAKLSVDGAAAKDVSATVVADANNTNIKTVTFAYTDSTKIGDADADVLDDGVTVNGEEGFTVISAQITDAGALEVKLNEFIARPTAGTTTYEFDGNAKDIKFGKRIGDTATNNNVEIAYRTSATSSDYEVIKDEDLRNPKLFTWSGEGVVGNQAEYNAPAADGKYVSETTHVNRDNNGTVIPSIITLTGVEGTKYEGLVFEAPIKITPLDISSTVAVAADLEENFSIPHVTYKRGAVVSADFLKETEITDPTGVKVTLKINNTDTVRSLEDTTDYKVSYEGRTDTEGGTNGVLTDENGKVSDNAAENVNAVNVGLYTATLNFTGDFTGTYKQSFRVMPQKLSKEKINGTTPVYGAQTTVIKNTVPEIYDKSLEKFDDGTTTTYTKEYDRTSDIAVVKALGDQDPFGLTLTTYKAEVMEDGITPKTDNDGNIVYSSTPVNDCSAVGTYKTVVTVSGNYVAENANDEASIVWNVTPYNVQTDGAAAVKPNRFVDDTSKWVGFAVNASTGKIEAGFDIRDNIATDLSAQAGVLLVNGTEYKAQYKIVGSTEDYADAIPTEYTKTGAAEKTAVTKNDKINVKFTFIGNYTGTVEVLNCPIEEYKLNAGATVLDKKVGNNEQVKYQYGDEITAKVQGVPQVLTQESRYYEVDLDQNGAPTGGTADSGLQQLTALVKAVTDADAEIAAKEAAYAADPTNADKKTALDNAIKAKKAVIDALYTKTKATPVAREKSEGSSYEDKGYVVVVFVNRDATSNTVKPIEGTNDYAANDGYKSFFDSAVGVSKGITVSKRTVDQNSTVDVEFVKSLLPYIGRPYTEVELMNNIKKVTVDGKVVYERAADAVDFTADDLTAAPEGVAKLPFRLADIDGVTYKNVDSYSLKLTFDATNADTDTLANSAYVGNANYSGSYTTNISTQRFSIVAAQLTAADFNVNATSIVAVITKDDATKYVHVNTVNHEDDKGFAEYIADGWTVTGYIACQDGEAETHEVSEEILSGPNIIYDGNPHTIPVVAIATADHAAYGKEEKALTGETMDYQVTGVTQTAAGEYELTIKGVKNTKGTVVVKWKIKGLDFTDFTATPDKTNFDYNGQGQSPKFTVTRTKDNVTTTLTEGKEFAVEYYTDKELTKKLDATPKNVGEYYAKIVGINSYFGATYKSDAEPVGFKFTIAPASTLDITIEDKAGADFSYNGEALIDRVDELFDIKVAGKALAEDAQDYTFHIVPEGKTSDASGQKNIGKYQIAVTVYDDNYQPKTSAQHSFEITPKLITLSNITANVKTAVYGAPVAQINDSITFDYDGVIDADKDKVSVKDFRGFVVVSDDYRAGSPAGEYTLVYNGDYKPTENTPAANYKAKKFTSDEKITIAKKDLADAKDNVSLVVVKSDWANTDPKVAGAEELAANQVVYNGKPYQVYIQKNDNGLMTMADLKLTGTPKALHAGSDYEVVATASAKGNYTGTTELSLEWALNKCEINHNVTVSLADALGHAPTNNTITVKSGKASIGSNADVGETAQYCVVTDVQYYMVDKDGKKIVAPQNSPKAGLYVDKNGALMPYASEAAGDYTVYFYQLDDKGEPIEDTKTTGYPTEGGKYRATVLFSNDFALVNTTTATDDPDFVPQRAEIGHVDFTIKGTPVNAAIYDLNQLSATADLTDGNINNDNKATAFSRVYGDAIEPNFQIDVYGNTGEDLVTATVDVTKMRKYEFVAAADTDEDKIPAGAVRMGEEGDWYKLTSAVYDGTAGFYDLEGAVVMNNNAFSCDFQNVEGFTEIGGNLAYEVKRSTDYTIQFDHENNVFALNNNGKAVAGYQVVDNNSGKVMKEGVDYTLDGSNEVKRTGTYTLFVEGIGNYAETAHADWVVVNGDTSVDAKFYAGNTVSFKEQVEFNFFADIKDDNYVDGAYVIFTYDHYGTQTEVKKMINRQDTLKDINGTHYRFRLPLTASEMAIPVKAELYLKNAAKPVDTKTRSIKDYAETAISLNMDGSDVLKAMLNYGGYTQVALGNNTKTLANANANIKEDVSAVQPKSKSTFVRPTPYEGTTTVAVAGIPQSVKIKFTPSVTYRGTSVLTKSKLYVRHYFTVDPSVDEQELEMIMVSAYFDRETGSFTARPKYYQLCKLPKNSTGYYLDMPAEMAYNLDEDRGTVRVYNFPGTVTNAEAYTGANGQTVAAGATTYKVGAWALQGDGKHDYADFNGGYCVDKATGKVVEPQNLDLYDQILEDDEEIGANFTYKTNNIYSIEVNNYNVVDYCETIANNSKQTTANKNMVKALYAYYQAAEAYVAKRTNA